MKVRKVESVDREIVETAKHASPILSGALGRSLQSCTVH